MLRWRVATTASALGPAIDMQAMTRFSGTTLPTLPAMALVPHIVLFQMRMCAQIPIATMAPNPIIAKQIGHGKTTMPFLRSSSGP